MSPLCNPCDTRFAMRNGTRLIINPFAGVWNSDTRLALVTCFINELWKQLLSPSNRLLWALDWKKKPKNKGWREYLEFFGCHCCSPPPQGIHRIRSLHPNLVKKVVKLWRSETGSKDEINFKSSQDRQRARPEGAEIWNVSESSSHFYTLCKEKECFFGNVKKNLK